MKKNARDKPDTSFKSFKQHHIISYHMISYHIILHEIKKKYSISRKYIPCQESIYHVHTAYSKSRKHIPCPYTIYHVHTPYCITRITSPMTWRALTEARPCSHTEHIPNFRATNYLKSHFHLNHFEPTQKPFFRTNNFLYI